MIYGKYWIIHLEKDHLQLVKNSFVILEICFFFEYLESSTITVNAQRKSLTARTSRTSNQQPAGTTRGGGRGGGNTRQKIRNWNTRDD